HLGTDAHPAHSSREPTTASAEHLARINQVLAAIIPRPLLRIAQAFIRLANLLELLRGRLVARVLVRVVHDGELAVGLFDLVVARVPLHAQQLVVVLALRLFELELRVLDVVLDVGLARVRFVDGLVFAHGLVPGAGFAEGTRPRLARFEVGRVEGEGAVTVGDGGFVVFQLRGGRELILPSFDGV
ncbi:MAG: hypothetical protein Q9177_001009, partial [Variospora cf. flavescens]